MTGNLTKRECHCNAKKGRIGGCYREIDKLAPINTLRELAAFDRRHLVKNNNSAIIHFHPPALRSKSVIRFGVSLFTIRSRIGTKFRVGQGTLVCCSIEGKKVWGGKSKCNRERRIFARLGHLYMSRIYRASFGMQSRAAPPGRATTGR